MPARRRRRSILVVCLSLVGALVLLAGALFVSFRFPSSTTAGSSQVVVTLSAAPGGHISPAGAVAVAAGSQISVSAWNDDPNISAWLMVDGKNVETTPGSGGKATYQLTADHDETVIASFAQLAQKARMLDEATASAIESVAQDGSQIIFSGFTPQLSGLAVDDILVNGPSWQRAAPLMVKVTGISRSGSRTVVETAPATLSEVVSNASIEVDQPLQETGRATVARDGVGPIVFGPPAAYADGDSGPDPVELQWSDSKGRQVTVSGRVTIDVPRLHVSFDVCCGSANPFDFHWPRYRFEASVSETASADVTLAATLGADLKNEALVFKHDFAPIEVLPFTWVTPEIQVGAGATIRTEAGISLSGSVSANVRAGVHYDNGWSPINEAKSTFSGSARPTVGGEATIYPLIRAEANIDGLCGPYFEIRPGLYELTADLLANPWWELDSGVGFAGGARCFFTKPYEMASAVLLRQRVQSAGGPFPTPTPLPTPTAALTPTAIPTLTPTSADTQQPLAVPTAGPPSGPTPAPSSGPTGGPTSGPTAESSTWTCKMVGGILVGQVYYLQCRQGSGDWIAGDQLNPEQLHEVCQVIAGIYYGGSVTDCEQKVPLGQV